MDDMGLREVRISKGVTQVALAAKTGIKQQAISRFERGGENPNYMTLTTAKKLCDALHCSPWDLMVETNETKSKRGGRKNGIKNTNFRKREQQAKQQKPEEN